MDLEKVRQFFPDFQMRNFDIFDTITSLKWETVYDDYLGEEHKNLSLTMVSPDKYQIQLDFLDVASFKFDGSGQISGFYIEDMSSRGYESCVRYEVGDYEYEEDVISFYCNDVMIKEIIKL